jgi:hypothetical protein
MTNRFIFIINSLKVPKIKKILLYEMKFLVPNYSCLQNSWLGGYRSQIPVLSLLCPQLNLLNPPPTPPPNKIPRYATGCSRVHWIAPKKAGFFVFVPARILILRGLVTYLKWQMTHWWNTFAPLFVSSWSRKLAEEQTETSEVGLDLREATNFCSHNRLNLEGQIVLVATAIAHISQAYCRRHWRLGNLF